MALIRRTNPRVTLPTLQDRINRMFDEVFPSTEREDFGLFAWQPTVDTYEKDDAIEINAELPGVNKDDIAIDVQNNVLSISGERKHDENVNENNCYRRERFYGKFQRAFTLPEGVDTDNIDASYADGVLKVTIPKTEKSQAKKIEVK